MPCLPLIRVDVSVLVRFVGPSSGFASHYSQLFSGTNSTRSHSSQKRLRWNIKGPCSSCYATDQSHRRCSRKFLPRPTRTRPVVDTSSLITRSSQNASAVSFFLFRRFWIRAKRLRWNSCEESSTFRLSDRSAYDIPRMPMWSPFCVTLTISSA